MLFAIKRISRRTALRGLGAALALPLLEAMGPPEPRAHQPHRLVAPRFMAIEMVHGAAGSTEFGEREHLWSPASTGGDFQFTPTLRPLERLRDYITIVSNTDLRNAGPLSAEEDGPMADHARSSAVFLTGSHPSRSLDANVQSGTSLDQMMAKEWGAETRLPSVQICIEDLRVLSDDCGYGYSCAYAHTISWASSRLPLAMQREPRELFERLVKPQVEQHVPRRTDAPAGSVLNGTSDARIRLGRKLGAADRRRVEEHLEDVAAVESRIQAIETRNRGQASQTGPADPSSVPDSFEEHAELMFELVRLAFVTDVTRVCTLKLGVDRSQRIYPESGVDTPFHTLSHHRQEPQRILEFGRLNRYHVGVVAAFLERLRKTSEGNGNLLSHSAVLYGSPMGDSHVHGHANVPIFIAGHAQGRLRGNRHVRCATGTSAANVLLTLARKFGVDIHQIGDSTGEVAV